MARLEAWDSAMLPSNERALVLGLGPEERIELRYITGKSRGQLLTLPATLLRRPQLSAIGTV